LILLLDILSGRRIDFHCLWPPGDSNLKLLAINCHESALPIPRGTTMQKLLIASIVTLTMSANSVFAAEMGMPVKAPPPAPPTYSWSGCYVDAGVGYGLWNQDHFEFTTATGVPINATSTNGGRGWLGRFGGGCDYQIGSSWVIGALADYDVQDIKGTLSGIGVEGGTPAYGDEKETGAWYAGGRVGYLITPGLLGYVDGGYTETRFDGVTLLPFSATPLAFSHSIPSNTYHGWFLGGGYEYALNFLPIPIHGLFWRTEYRYAQYDSADLLISNSTASINSRKEVQTITSGLLWRFNWWQ
jgi:outer membrane immunogenic protein